MIRKRIPKRLWDYGLIWESEIMSCIAVGTNGHTGFEQVTGETPDISEWLNFDFYDWVWFWDKPGEPNENPKIGCWLGVFH